MNSLAEAVLEGLNPPQREAVQTLDGPVFILAGPGSGKTRVVTRRIANLIAHGVLPWQILAITFTNKAAGEMRERVEAMVGRSGVWVSTFHSFCARLLRREAVTLGLSPDFTIFDEEDVQKVIANTMTELGIDDKRLKPQNLRGLISDLKNRGVLPEEVGGSSFHERILQKVYEAYMQAMRRQQALDFDDLLLKGVLLLRDHPEIRQKYSERFSHILVDEYQDTNGCQYQLVKLLGSAHRNVCVTGDPDQSIYAWRGADISNILTFENDFPNAKVVRLEQNYRSTKKILRIASAVIGHNAKRKSKQIWTENEDGSEVKVKLLGDEQLEAHEAVAMIDAEAGKGRRYSEFAILYRTNAQSRSFETRLVERGIPYRLFGGTPFYERREVKDALAYLRLCVNPSDDVSFKRIVNVPRRKIGKAAIDKIEAFAQRMGCSMSEALDRPGWIEREFAKSAAQAIYGFARFMDSLRNMPRSPVGPLVKYAVEASGLHESLKEAGEEDRMQNVEQLVNAATLYDEEKEAAAQSPSAALADIPEALEVERSPGLADFLENAALTQSTDRNLGEEEQADRVTLMTLHMAKGLEFPVVWLAGLEEGLLPMVRAKRSLIGDEPDPQAEADALEEERRLFYVGVTRAMQELYLSHAQSRLRFGKRDTSIPSRFLDELPKDAIKLENKANNHWAHRYGAQHDVFGHYEKRAGFGQRFGFGSGRKGQRIRFSDFATTPTEDEFEQEAAQTQVAAAGQLDPEMEHEYSQVGSETLEVGDRVEHHKFGIGTVEGFSGGGLSRKIKIHFRNSGTKLLLLSLAKLKKL